MSEEAQRGILAAINVNRERGPKCRCVCERENKTFLAWRRTWMFLARLAYRSVEIVSS